MVEVNFKQLFTRYAGKHWVIALSGGADSRLLLELAAKARDLALGVEAVYVHHHLQDIADSWADFCAGECLKLNIKFTVEHVFVATKGSIEANARDARYEALGRYIDHNSVLFTAHHADDLLETVLLALMRGSGLDGMTPLPIDRPFGKGILARPLLDFSRADIESYCQKFGLSYVTDPTNNEKEYDRNFIRHDIAPLLKERFPQALKSVKASVTTLGRSKRVYTSLLHEKIDQLKKVHCGFIGLDLERLDGLAKSYLEPLEFQAELMREFLKTKFGIVLNTKRLTELQGFIGLSSDNHASLLCDGFRLFVFNGGLYVVPDTEELRGQHVKMRIGTCVELGGFLVSIEQTPCIGVPDYSLHTDAKGDIESIFFVPKEVEELELEFAPSLSTRLHPALRPHSQILKNLWKEHSVPFLLRPFCPLIRGNGEALALAGVFRCQNSLVDANMDFDAEGFKLVVLRLKKCSELQKDKK